MKLRLRKKKKSVSKSEKGRKNCASYGDRVIKLVFAATVEKVKDLETLCIRFRGDKRMKAFVSGLKDKKVWESPE